MKKVFFTLAIFAAILSGCNKQEQTAEAISQEVDSVAVVEDTIPQPQRIGIKMTLDGGVYTLPCLVNGVRMNFIFDTGASNVCISLTEALFLYKNGYIEDDDLGEKSYSQVADGRITANMKLNIKTIEIEGMVLRNVDALVSSSMEAPLLLGQSAIQKLGKVELDQDSLFITGLVENPQQPQKEEEEEVVYVIPPSNPQVSWWDKVKTYFGSTKKVDEYIKNADNAVKNDLYELGILYCNKALECDKKSAKAYTMRAHINFWNRKYETAYDDYMKAIISILKNVISRLITTIRFDIEQLLQINLFVALMVLFKETIQIPISHTKNILYS